MITILNLKIKTNSLYSKAIKILNVIIVLLLSENIYAQNWNQIVKAAASDRLTKNSAARASGDNYGYAVAVDGNYAIVGVYQEDEDTEEINSLGSAGAAYILFNNAGTWTQVKKITAVSRGENDFFGYSVSISGDYVIVGAYWEDQDANEANTLSNAGSAYIFKKDQGGTDNWGLLKKITPTNRATSDNFGYAVAISGNYAIVGAYQEDEDANDVNTLSSAGSAYIFRKDQGGTDNWGQQKKITPQNRAANDYFGSSVAINGDYAIVGAYQEDHNVLETDSLSNAGAAYIFKQDQGGTNNWGLLKKITPTNRAANDNFGYSVAISGEYTIVGAYQEDEDTNDINTLSSAGAAYIFKKDQGGTDNWGLLKKLTPNNRLANDFFGWSVAISGDYLIVGAYQEDEDANDANTLTAAGSAFIFKKDQGGIDNWGLLKKITPTNRLANDRFGWSVAISSDYTIVGAPLEDEDENDANNVSTAGSAYIYKKDHGSADNWGLLQKTVMIGKVAYDNYGWSVAISGNYAIVGAYRDDEDEAGNIKLSAGSVYILKNTNGIWQQIKKITPTNANRNLDDQFGYSVAISGDYAIVGAPFEDEDASETNTLSSSGSAYIFKKDQGGTDNWGLLKKITPNVRAIGARFGWSIAINGDYAIVGATMEGNDTNETNNLAAAGAAYIFNKNNGGADNWGQQKKLTPTYRATNDIFGWTVAISGDYAIVGAYREDHDTSEANALADAGAAYIFKKDQGGSTNWGLLKKITPNNRAVNDYFGVSVSIDGEYAIVGAYFEDEDANETNTLSSAGSAYIFKKDQGGTDNWGLLKKITPTNRLSLDQFGYAVAISGDYAIVGAFFETEDANESNTLSSAGSAYIFKKDQGGTDNWGLLKKITSADRSTGDYFGWAVAISANCALVGAYQDQEDATSANTLFGAGSVYIFYNGCSPQSALPNTANTTYTGSYKETDALGWTHYCTSSDQLLLSLKIGSSGAEINANEVFLKTGATNTFSSTSQGGMVTNPNGYAIIDRRWNIIPTTQPSSGTVGVKYYFTNTEYNNLVSALASLANPTVMTNPNQMQIYKSSSDTTYANPHTVPGIILEHGATPSTLIWKWAQQGTSDHSAQFEVTSFSGGGGGYGGGNTPLPVAMLSFSGKLVKTDAHLFWTTASEINNNYFEIERSIDGINFTKIGQVKGKGNTNQLSNYTFIDFNVSNLGNNLFYYRLKQVDYNGDSDYTQTIMLNLNTAIEKVTIWPNPFNNEVNLILPNSSKTQVTLFNLFGSVVFNKNIEDESTTETLNTTNLPAGIYILSITQKEVTTNYKVMKK